MKMRRFMYLVLLVLNEVNTSYSECTTFSHFCYDDHGSHCMGPACWYLYGEGSSVCGAEGTRQSPINIVTSTVVENSDIQAQLIENINVAQGGILTNTGHSVQLNMNFDGIGEYRYKIGEVTDDYFDIIQIHFHYGTVNNQGSEHKVDNIAHEGELHAVGKYEDELAVLGFFLQVSPSNINNTELGKLVQYFGDIKSTGETYTVTDFDFKAFVGDSMGHDEVFYRYAGSLTTPPCSEIVTWTVMAKPIQVSQAQMEDFRSKVVLDDYSSDNFRPVQNDNNENVVVYKGYLD